jgi:hypothetical protein
MPNPSVTWTDGAGAAELACITPALNNWTPDVNEVGESTDTVTSPAIHFFSYRQDQLIAFDIANIASALVGLALRLKSHLTTGGSCLVHTRDADGTVYTALVAPGTVPQFALSDATEMEYTLSLVVVWTAVSTE